ncbi:hypothetical protein HMPREF0872_00510 [Veillonella montpellierensis DNF00314]|uniref:Cobalt ABC transporter permease n=1 Tax=Veillonella montpellierensis DNF00314 TaxID=1401067 RepID=A0A096AN49_9FIRM|nr:cobalt ECF transporter T component CbiQ [Veillonella montpellierensis]KGF48116.1 hypothetical protein HMPREF0872_00510 [Veillonella montpellierensis DNF00314]
MSHNKKYKHKKHAFSIDMYAYHSNINGWNPGLKLLLATCMICSCIVLDNLYVSMSIILISMFITVVIGKMNFREYLIILSVPITFLIVGSLVIAFNIDSVERGLFGMWTPLGYIFASHESLNTVLHLWGKAFGGMSAMFMLSLSTPSNEIFSVLRKLYVPTLVIELMNMVYRFVFIMIETFLHMHESAESRLGFVNYRTSLKTFGCIASNLFIVSMKKGDRYYDAMEARCYDGNLVFLETEKDITVIQSVMVLVSMIIILGIWIMTK